MNLLRSALSLLIHGKGEVSTGQIDELLDYYGSKRGIHVDREKYEEALVKARERYYANCTNLFVCTDSSCLKKSFLHPSERSLERLGRELGCPVEVTGCHWRCDEAPVVTFKDGAVSKTFTNCSTEADWQKIREHILRATKKQEFLLQGEVPKT